MYEELGFTKTALSTDRVRKAVVNAFAKNLERHVAVRQPGAISTEGIDAARFLFNKDIARSNRVINKKLKSNRKKQWANKSLLTRLRVKMDPMVVKPSGNLGTKTPVGIRRESMDNIKLLRLKDEINLGKETVIKDPIGNLSSVYKKLNK